MAAFSGPAVTPGSDIEHPATTLLHWQAVIVFGPAAVQLATSEAQWGSKYPALIARLSSPAIRGGTMPFYQASSSVPLPVEWSAWTTTSRTPTGTASTLWPASGNGGTPHQPRQEAWIGSPVLWRCRPTGPTASSWRPTGWWANGMRGIRGVPRTNPVANGRRPSSSGLLTIAASTSPTRITCGIPCEGWWRT